MSTDPVTLLIIENINNNKINNNSITDPVTLSIFENINEKRKKYDWLVSPDDNDLSSDESPPKKHKMNDVINALTFSTIINFVNGTDENVDEFVDFTDVL